MSKFQELQTRHLALLARYEQDRESKELLSDVQAFIDHVVAASKEISNSRERNHLRANLRFWGAFIYDHTKVYPPNLTLLPSEKTPLSSRSVTGIVGGILAGVVFLSIVLLGIYKLVLVPRPTASKATLQQTREAQNTQVAQTMTAIAEVAQWTPTAPSSPLPSATAVVAYATPSQTSVYDSFTATIGALYTQAAISQLTPTSTPVAAGTFLPTPTSPPLFSPTPFGTPGSTILYPNTGGGGSYEIVKYEEADCSNRSLKINVYAVIRTSDPVTITLYRSGTGEVAARQVISEDENGNGSALFSLTNPTENTLYLLSAKNSILQGQMVILQFLSNCTRNKTVVDLSLGIPVSEQSFDSTVILLTWGASYNTEPAWLAEFKINNSDAGIFWLVDKTNPDNPVTQPIEGTFRINAPLCTSAYFELVETTGGIYKKQEFLLHSPMSFCP